MSENVPSADTVEKGNAEHVPCHVVGIGASAGGLEALEELFENLDADTGMAFIVIQHLSPDFKSHMDELLARRTKMRIQIVEDGVLAEPDHVYLIPPDKEMVISGRKLLLTDRNSNRGLSHPIDQFFRSLASDVGPYSIGVVLSGTGSDGSRGIKDIHESGGLVLCQDEESARFDGMPLNAIATGIVDKILPPDRIARALTNYVSKEISSDENDDIPVRASSELKQVLEVIREQFNVDFTHYKLSTVERRINRRADLINSKSLEDYLELLKTDPGQLHHLLKDLLIGVTQFFRDPDAFECLRPELTTLLEQKASEKHSFRVWVAGCSTGEEAFSIAIMISEIIRKSEINIEFQVFATDVYNGSIQFAANGLYPPESVAHLPEDLINRYFTSQGNGYQISKELRHQVVFAPHNLLTDPPFTQMDLVTCRNLLIYLTPAAQKKVLSLLHFSLKLNGILFLGPSESPADLSDEFENLSKRWRIFSKRRENKLPLSSRISFGIPANRLSLNRAEPLQTQTSLSDRSRMSVYESLLNSKMPPSILISKTYETLHIFNGAEKFLRVASGRQSSLIFDLLNENIQSGIRRAIQQAEHKKHTVRFSGLRIEMEGEERVLDLTIEPVTPTPPLEPAFLIEFHHRDKVDHDDVIEVNTTNSDVANDRIHQLESELTFSEEKLQANIEELQSANEEMQASNEELVASNEELQSTNEELHSVNEELYTINSEHQRRVEQLAQANNDMDNLLATTRVGVIYLDNELCIRRFTPDIARQLHLIRQDIGRSFEGFVHHLNYPNMIEFLQSVIEEHTEKELELKTQNNIDLLLRALPYRSDNQIEGVVLTLIDITAHKQAQAEVEQFKFMTESAVESIALVRRNGTFHYVNPSMCELLGYSREELLSKRNIDIDRDRNLEEFQQQFESRLAEGTVFESEWTDAAENRIPVEISAKYIELGGVQYICKIVRDISERKSLFNRLEQMGQMIEASNDAIILWNFNGTIQSWNKGATQLYGYTPEEAIGRITHELFQSEHSQSWQSIEDQLLEKGEWYGPIKHTRRDGVMITVSSRHQLLINHRNTKQILEINRDITQEQEYREKLERANRIAKQASKAKSEFLTNMSHELRTPMTAMLGFADILRIESQDPAFQDKIDTIKRNGQYLLALLNDILDLSKIEAGKMEVDDEQVGVLEVIEDVRSLMSVRSAEVGIPLLFEFKTDVPHNIMGDRIRVRQILVNLISNALKFTDEGEVKVVVAIDDTDRAEPKLNIDVIDTGIGIPLSEQKRLFKPFSQVARDMTRNYSGTGLGLSISKRLAEKMQASITVKSKPGEGSRFRLSFPLDDVMLSKLVHVRSLDELEELKESNEHEALPQLNCKVLLADDRRDVWFVAKYFLETAGANVTVAENGQQAVDAALSARSSKKDFELILMDMQMPVMDGRDAVRNLRDAEFKIPIIALTADAMEGHREACLEIGCDGYCPKPINGPELIRMVDRMVREHRQKV
ncbi:Autoinducer 2 sensor kinase/phosphatase LuxQ [Polystyrenella longa]|uniref:Autoinducer 2 sensor kinase/phosphatase LuxQ n=1 Tax=Polystyrenella longa TaxID=2528007 RepID=A0A518CLD4_9PLAN|nr:chemotaxis protein CheB [Polystyrenella longa]QDU80038.1 Autoinducer 2 sensor kinase/phosphatase LuxQ [Polystyrenella longa]